MKTAGCAIDPWKLAIFERHLTEAGYDYRIIKMNPAITMLKIKCKFVSDLQPVIVAAQEECRRAGSN